MTKPTKPAYELSDADKRDLIQLIQAGKPLPEKYRFVLFEDKREVELVWNGKSAEVCTAVLPFQTLEHVDEPREETKSQGQLFDARGRQTQGWTNKLIWGDNKLILSSLKAGALRRQIEEAGGLKLIYIDPPFDVGADFSMDIEIGGETFHKEPNLLEQIAYRDTWGRGADSFISMIYERLILMRDLMHPEGSIYVHCDWRVSGYIRLVLDEVFGRENYRGEIVWKRDAVGKGAKKRAQHWPKTFDSALMFARSQDTRFNFVPAELTDKQLKEFRYQDPDGRRFKRTTLGDYSDISIAKMEADGYIYVSSSGLKYKKYYLDEYTIQLDSIWTDVPGFGVASSSQERLDYPTQKPETLLERIIEASSNVNDVIADFFVGSGTTAAVAEKLGRRWIATDLGKFAIHTTRKRLIGVQRELKAADKNFRAFEVLNLGRYERQAYLNVGGRLSPEQREQALLQKEAEFRELILRAYKGEPLVSDGFFHGKHGGRLVVIGPINLPVGRLFVEEVITEMRKRGATRVDVLAFEFEMGLFPAVLEEAKGKGIDLTPKYIPAEVFDKRAVDKGQVVFHDISFVEATPRYAKGKTAKDKLTVAIELTDFSVYYTQGAAEAAIAALKDGKSDVICDQGQLVKISKNKDGAVKREVLTKTWTDWVDYWAVDFDYMSRKEVIKVPTALNHGEVAVLPGFEHGQQDMPLEFEDQWTGGYIFENEWQSFRTRKQRELELITAEHAYDRPGRYIVAVKVVDIFGNDTMTLVPVNVG
ncbi:site-specific DNA-methyltransferase [Dokdonella sp.]|uniref:site-specific DNA-methyltransferase n=1 Tax=Dokdonella sp. TaxID=2291710 RepID=UPI0037835831